MPPFGCVLRHRPEKRRSPSWNCDRPHSRADQLRSLSRRWHRLCDLDVRGNFQFWPNWTPIVVVGGTFFVGEMLADYVLAPRIIGRRVKLNPVWLMFALFAFGALFGFIGLLLAVPLAAAIGVLLRFAIRKSGAQTMEAATPP